MHYVYVLKSLRNNKLYKGYTNDLKRRLNEHKLGRSTFTKDNGPWELIYYEGFKSKYAAKTEEIFLKTGKGRERLRYILGNIIE